MVAPSTLLYQCLKELINKLYKPPALQKTRDLSQLIEHILPSIYMKGDLQETSLLLQHEENNYRLKSTRAGKGLYYDSKFSTMIAYPFPKGNPGALPLASSFNAMA